MARAKSSKSWISPELAQVLKDKGFLLPETDEWRRLSEDLALSTESRHILCISRIAGQFFSEAFENFAEETVLRIPANDFIECFKEGKLDKLAKAVWIALTESWVIRTRIFLFREPVTRETLSLLNGFIDNQTPLPFIEAISHQAQIIDISMVGFAAIKPEERYKSAVLLSRGLELFRSDLTRRELTRLMAKTIKGTWGGARRKPKDFTAKRCAQLVTKTQELQPLWEFITRFFETLDYEAGCVTMIKAHSKFKELSGVCSGEVPESLLKRVFQRKSQRGKKYWPLAFALLHARLELGIKSEYSYATLYTYYRRGKKLLATAARLAGRQI